jgi:hypothetical protein
MDGGYGPQGVTGISARHMMVVVGQSPASLKKFLHNIFSKAVHVGFG